MVLLSKRNKIAIRLNGYQTNTSEKQRKKVTQEQSDIVLM